MKVPWSEYWAFLDVVVDIETTDGLQKFEAYLRRCLWELIDGREAERQRHEMLQNMSVCQLMQLLNLSEHSPIDSSAHQSSDNRLRNGIEPEVQDTVCTTWPPSLAKVLAQDATDAKVMQDSVSNEVLQILPDLVSDANRLNGSRDADEASDRLSAASSDSFHTADDDSDLEFGLASDWPDDFDWQAVEPFFIYG